MKSPLKGSTALHLCVGSEAGSQFASRGRVVRRRASVPVWSAPLKVLRLPPGLTLLLSARAVALVASSGLLVWQ